MQRQRLSPRPEVGVMREARQAELLALIRQGRRDLGSTTRAHQEHDLVVAVVLGEGALGTEKYG